MSDSKVILVTGASSGNGQATARLLAQHGHQVFGTSRNPVTAEPIPQVRMLALDVCSDDSVATCINAVLAEAGRLDVVVNNAGYELGGALEEASLAEARAQFETNFFGAVRVVKAVLPTMRRQRSGQIVNISSLAGLSPIPFLGMYSASKFALEGYSEALRHELKPFGVHVSAVEAGFLKTPLSNKRELAVERIGEYAPWRQRALEAVREYELKGPGPDLVAQAVLEIVQSRTPRLRYVIGPQARRISIMRRLLPAGAFEQGTRSFFRLGQDS
jgi:NAD(P)-dependent dehydrogenase (short-subunit alcohol dehydrogenase family)